LKSQGRVRKASIIEKKYKHGEKGGEILGTTQRRTGGESKGTETTQSYEFNFGKRRDLKSC